MFILGFIDNEAGAVELRSVAALGLFISQILVALIIEIFQLR